MMYIWDYYRFPAPDTIFFPIDQHPYIDTGRVINIISCGRLYQIPNRFEILTDLPVGRIPDLFMPGSFL